MDTERDRAVETAVSIVLRLGVIISVAIIVTGVTATFIHHPDYFSSRPALGRLIDAHGSYIDSVGAVMRGVRQQRGQAIVMLGVLALIATPLLRVAISVVLFAIEHDRLYVGITLVVLLLLLASFVIGAAG